MCGGGREAEELRSWEELVPDVIGLIFSKLSLRDLLMVVPKVCRSWAEVAAAPYCWQKIDIEEWCMMHSKLDQVDRMLRLLLPWSSGSLRQLSVYAVPDDDSFAFIADHASSLESLRIPKSHLSDAVVAQVAAKFQKLKFLDVSYCESIGAEALESFGRHCKSLVSVKRTMHPMRVLSKSPQDDEALAIARTMPQIKHLEMPYGLLTTAGVREILSACLELEFLDLRGCWYVRLQGEEWLAQRQKQGLKVLGPEVVDQFDLHYQEPCNDEEDDDDEWNSIGDEEFDSDWHLHDGADEMLDSNDGSADDVWDDYEEDQRLDGLGMRIYVPDPNHCVG
ncbi:F-box protein [Nymphaea thermarum]|nr:F-box protein [Nymphaea thermarum]